MNLSKKKLQELKDKKIQVKDLDSRHFIDASVIQDDHRENIKKLLNENICSFQEIVDKFKSINNLKLLLGIKKFFKELIKNNKLNTEDLRSLLNTIDNKHELDSLTENTYLLKSMIDNNIVSFKELIDKFKSIKDYASTPYLYDEPCLYILLENKKLFEELIENNKLNIDDLRYLLNTIDKGHEIYNLLKNTSLLRYIVDNGVSFKELIDKFKSIKNNDNDRSCLYILLDYKKLIQNNTLNKEDLRYLLNTIDNIFELRNLCWNTPLIKHILNEFVLDKEAVDRFNAIIENDKWSKVRNLHTRTIFEYIEDKNKDNEEILNLNDLNRYACSIDDDQRLELAEILKDSKIAQNRLIQLIENTLEDQYDFEQLKNILTKDDDKKLKTKFNF